MVNYTCDCCSFSTTKKSTYNDHLASKKHLNKINGCSSSCSVVSNITEPEFITTSSINDESILRIKELENELKMKELEISNLKAQLQMKDEMINVLKQQQSSTPIIQNKEEKPPTNIKVTLPKKLAPKSIVENLHLSRQNAPTIEEFLSTQLYNEEINKAFKSVKFEIQKADKLENMKYYNEYSKLAILPNTVDGLLTNSSYQNLIVNVFCGMINNTEKHLCPIYCSDKQRKVFYVKTNADGWKKLNDDEFIKIQKIITSKIDIVAYIAIHNAKKLCQYHYPHYKKIYPEGLSQFEDVFDMKFSAVYSNIWNTANTHKYDDEKLEKEKEKLVGKHLKGSLSEITGDKVVKFAPLKEEPIALDIEEEEESYNEDE